MFYIAHISLAFIVVFLVAIAGLKTKTRLRRYFIFFIIDLFVWTFSVLAQQYCELFGKTQGVEFFGNLAYFGVAFLPVQMFQISMIITSSGIKSRPVWHSLLVIPILTQIVVWTNGLHGFFYTNYNYTDTQDIVFGWYFYVHTAYSYICILGAVFFIARFALSNRGPGDSGAQAFILLIGSVVPVAVNILFTMGVSGFTIFSTPVAFLVTVLAYFFGVIRYNLVRLSPIAMKTVMDKASDLYIVVDAEMTIIDYNEPFYKAFSSLLKLEKEINLNEALGTLNITGVSTDKILSIVRFCKEKRREVHKAVKIDHGSDARHYSAEFSPLIIEDDYYGCILLLRDITRTVRDMEEIKLNHVRLVEQEHLASLGQLIGGIAHNLKTPIMAMSGRAENLEALIDEYEESAGEEKVTPADHREIAKEMKHEVERIRDHIVYVSEVVTTVKDQTVKLNEDVNEIFTVGELVMRIDILMHHELIRNNIEYIYEEELDEETAMIGDVNSLIQIVDNIILNAIQAYAGEPGKLWLKIRRDGDSIIISVRDEAGGIPEDVQEKLFKQMTTTKGKDGTGLGLYISHSTIVGRYEGKMWFETTIGQGSEFFISIPLGI